MGDGWFVDTVYQSQKSICRPLCNLVLEIIIILDTPNEKLSLSRFHKALGYADDLVAYIKEGLYQMYNETQIREKCRT